MVYAGVTFLQVVECLSAMLAEYLSILQLQRDQKPLASIDLFLASAPRTKAVARAVRADPVTLSLRKFYIIAVLQTESAVEFVALKLWVPPPSVLRLFR